MPDKQHSLYNNTYLFGGALKDCVAGLKRPAQLQIAQKLDIDVNKVSRWRNRFVEKGLAGIEKNLPRGANHSGKNSKEKADSPALYGNDFIVAHSRGTIFWPADRKAIKAWCFYIGKRAGGDYL